MKKTSFFLFLSFILKASLIYSFNSHFIRESHYDHFKKGKLENVSINQLGHLFSSASQSLIHKDLSHPIIWSMGKDHNKNLYFISGNPSSIYKVSEEGAVEKIYSFEKLLVIMDIIIDSKNNLYLADSSHSRIIYFNPQKKNIITEYQFNDKYIWKMILNKSSESIYIATGLNASIYELIPSKGIKKIFTSEEENHFLSLAQKNSFLYFGGSLTKKLYQFNLESGKVSSLYQATAEIKTIINHAEEIFFIVSHQSSYSKKNYQSKINNIALQANDILSNQFSKYRSITSKISNQVKKARHIIKNKPYSGLYKVSSNNQIIELFKSVDYSFLDLAINEDKDRLYLSTNESNGIFYLDQASKVKHQQKNLNWLTSFQDTDVLKLLYQNNKLYAATANLAHIYLLDLDHKKQGNYQSIVYYFKQRNYWGKIFSNSSYNSNEIKIFIRTGNSDKVDETWSPWQEIKNEKISSPPSFAIQYKVEFLPSAQVNILKDIIISYFPIPQPIEINSIKFSKIPASTNKNFLKHLFFHDLKDIIKIEWPIKEKSAILSSLFIKTVGREKWIPLLIDSPYPYFFLDTSKFKDGTYKFKVVAHRQFHHFSQIEKWNNLSYLNSYKISDSFTVDSLPPSFSNLSIIENKDKLEIKLDVQDYSLISGIFYSLNHQNWVFVNSYDHIYDSKTEHIEFSISKSDLISEENVLSIKAIDIHKNISTKVVNLKLKND